MEKDFSAQTLLFQTVCKTVWLLTLPLAERLKPSYAHWNYNYLAVWSPPWWVCTDTAPFWGSFLLLRISFFACLVCVHQMFWFVRESGGHETCKLCISWCANMHRTNIAHGSSKHKCLRETLYTWSARITSIYLILTEVHLEQYIQVFCRQKASETQLLCTIWEAAL